MEIEVSINIEEMYERACELMGEQNKGVLSWKELYDEVTKRRGYKEGELEKAVADMLDLDEEAAKGFIVSWVDEKNQTVNLEDLESAGCVDLSDEEDAHNIPYIKAFRHWIKFQPRSIKF